MERARALTTKEAKAAHKKRQSGALSEVAQRQLERDSLLHRRAWAIKDREKSRLVLAQKKAETDQRARADLASEARFATQVRKDKFGHKSSQFHLGAFFTKASDLDYESPKAIEDDVTTIDYSTEFGSFDDGVDDEALLSALRTPSTTDTLSPPAPAESDVVNRAIGISFALDNQPTRSDDCSTNDIDWHAFDSSTQIARDLEDLVQADAEEVCEYRSGSLDSAETSLGLSSQDIERLDPGICSDRKTKEATQRAADRIAMPPPVYEHSALTTSDRKVQAQSAVYDITSTQLDGMFDDEVVLTQA